MATLVLAAGEHPKVVSERLGHSTIAITLDTYSHVLPGLQAAAAERLAEKEGHLRGRRSSRLTAGSSDGRRQYGATAIYLAVNTPSFSVARE